MIPMKEQREVARFGADRAVVRSADDVVLEAPLELRVAGESVLVTMRTPGNDVELIRGLLFAENAISADEIDRVQAAAPKTLAAAEVGNVVEFDVEPEVFSKRFTERALFSSSACGVCGASAVDALASNLEPVRVNTTVSEQVVAGLTDALRASQPVFDSTGAIHAAGLFDTNGEMLCVREDVGRHNAVDKVIGWALAENRLPASENVLVVSGRVSFEITQKAAAAGIPVVVAVSAPTSLAIDLAERFRICLCGFARAAQFNVYSHAFRVSLAGAFAPGPPQSTVSS